MSSCARAVVPGLAFLLTLGVAPADDSGDPAKGKTYFESNCALCHSVAMEAGTPVQGQGPSLVGVVGRKAASLPGVSYSKALSGSGLTWDVPTLDKFLTNPGAMVPGTSMPVSVTDATDRGNLIAFLATLKPSGGAAEATVPPTSAASAAPDVSGQGESSDWDNQKPGVQHYIKESSLPAPFATQSAGNGPSNVAQPTDAQPQVPEGFMVKPFATGLGNPRIVHIAPNGDIFVAETGAGRIHAFRAADGAESPTENQVFAKGLNGPFGLAFWPPGPNPQWLYVANNNSVVRFMYQNGDLQAAGDPQVIVPKLTDSHGGHSTRDLAFSRNGKRLFISVGSASNVADTMGTKTPEEIREWESQHGVGASWKDDTNRADILVTDPEGKTGLHTFATGIRNGVGIAVDPSTGELWTSVNERDGLGDNLVPDYITSVKEHGYYGWPWYYMGNHEDPRKKGERPDLAGKAIVPDVLLQSHSASLGLAFYTAKSGPAAFPAEYDGDIFAAEHGSWNRSVRTGYKVIRVRMNHGKATGEYDDFMTGFVVDNHSVWGRPVGVAVAHDGALLVTDDASGTLWRIVYNGKK